MHKHHTHSTTFPQKKKQENSPHGLRFLPHLDSFSNIDYLNHVMIVEDWSISPK